MAGGSLGYTEGGPTKLFTARVTVPVIGEANMERVVSAQDVLDSIGTPTAITSIGVTTISVSTVGMKSVIISARAGVVEDTEITVRLKFLDANGECLSVSATASLYFTDMVDTSGQSIAEAAVFENNVGASSAVVVVASKPEGVTINLYANAI